MTKGTAIAPHVVVTLVALAAIWGGAFTLMKVLVDDLSALEMAAGRLALGAVAVAAVLVLAGDARLPARRLLLPIAGVAVLDTLVPYMLVGWAETRIDSAAAAVLISAMPLFTVILAAGVLRQESVGPARLAGIVVGFGGVLVLIGGPAAFFDSGALGQLAVLGAAVSYAVAALGARALLRHVDPVPFTAAKLAIGAVIAGLALLAAGGGGGFGSLTAGDAAALATLGVVCTGLSFVMYFRVVVTVGTVAASTVTYIIPVFGLLFGAVFLGETISVSMLGGMVLIVTGVACVMYGPALDRAARLVGRRRRQALELA